MGQGRNEFHSGQGRPIELAHSPRPSHFPLVRLLQLMVLLQSERCPNARQLSDICEVSRRTIYRDLSTLDEAGIRVLYRPDRQGYQLARGMFLSAPKIEEQEAMALLVLARSWAADEDMGLTRAAGSAVDKLLQAFPEPLRQKLLALSEVVGNCRGGAESKSTGGSIQSLVLKSLAARHQVRIWMRGSSFDATESTKFAIYRLSRIDGRWCIVGRSSRDCAVCLIPLQQVERAEGTEEAYTIPPRFNLERFLTQVRPEIEEFPHPYIS
jgi:predicted DNA-binding transcriptional regulator YafY